MPKKVSVIVANRKTAKAVIQAIKNKLASLKHGYIIEDELKELEKLVSKIK